MAKFNIGDEVYLARPWGMAAQAGSRATVKSYGPEYMNIEWDKSDKRVNGQTDGGYDEKDFEKVRTNIVKLKPIQSEAAVKGGAWKWIVLNGSGEAVAMFVDEDEATEYKDQYGEYDGWTVREVLND